MSYIESVALSPFAHLVAQKLVEVPQLVGVGDLSIQRGVPLLRDSCGSADFDAGVSAYSFAAAVTGLRSGRVSGYRG